MANEEKSLFLKEFNLHTAQQKKSKKAQMTVK
jgi:hypothetical protein